MAADSPTPGTEMCAPDCAERTACPVVGEPGHWQCGTCPEHEEPRHHCGCPAAPSPVGTTEPPTEAQQDDELPWLEPFYRWAEVHKSPGSYSAAFAAGWASALAARPSADTETLLGRVGALADELDLWTLTEESKPNDDVWEEGYRSALRHAAFRIRAALGAR